jgi:hypothetical protein
MAENRLRRSTYLDRYKDELATLTPKTPVYGKQPTSIDVNPKLNLHHFSVDFFPANKLEEALSGGKEKFKTVDDTGANIELSLSKYLDYPSSIALKKKALDAEKAKGARADQNTIDTLTKDIKLYETQQEDAQKTVAKLEEEDA